MTFTQKVARRCAEQQVQVVSGGARGVDREALGAALEAGGTIVAVPAESLLKVVTDRTARNAIRDQQLTVVTPYDPEMGFTVGRAMSRNKIIYALADYALVVQFKTNEGGTWAGAVEQLGRNKPGSVGVPVFVRVANNPEDGWRKLQSKGARPFPEQEFFKGNVMEVLKPVAVPLPDLFPATPSTEPLSTPPISADAGKGVQEPLVQAVVMAPLTPSEIPLPIPSPEPITATLAAAEDDTCYRSCLTLLLGSLRQEPTKKQLSEIAKRLDLVPQQFNKWLDRAVKEGQVKSKKKGRQTVFIPAARAEESTLFGRDGDAA